MCHLARNITEQLRNSNVVPSACRFLLDEAAVARVSEIRSLWSDESERMLPGHDGNSNVVYDEARTVYCCDKVSDPRVRPVSTRLCGRGAYP